MGPTALLPLRRKAALARFEPANLGTKGQHATPRPPKSVLLYASNLILVTIAVKEYSLNDFSPFPFNYYPSEPNIFPISLCLFLSKKQTAYLTPISDLFVKPGHQQTRMRSCRHIRCSGTVEQRASGAV